MPAAQHKRRQTKRRKTGTELTRGQINRIIDVVLHRHFRGNPGLILLDGLVHAVVEDNPKQSIRKFAEYGVPALLKEMGRKKRRKSRRGGKAAR